MLKVKSPIVNRPSHSSVSDASSAHICFQWPRAGSVPQTPRLQYGITQYYLPPGTGEPVTALYMGGGQDLRILSRNLPGSEAGTNLYSLVNRGTSVWATFPWLLHSSALTLIQTCNLSLSVTSPARYRITTEPCSYLPGIYSVLFHHWLQDRMKIYLFITHISKVFQCCTVNERIQLKGCCVLCRDEKPATTDDAATGSGIAAATPAKTYASSVTLSSESDLTCLSTLSAVLSCLHIEGFFNFMIYINVYFTYLHCVSKKTGPLLRFEITPTNCA